MTALAKNLFELGISIDRISEMGLDISHEDMSSLSFGECVRSLSDDFTVDEIAKMLNKKNDLVSEVLESMEIEPQGESKTSHSVDERFFDNVESCEVAYWLGWMFSAGYVKNNMIDFGLSVPTKDKAVLYSFSHSLSYGGQASHSENEAYDSKISVLEVRSPKICTDLVYLGCAVEGVSSSRPPKIGEEFAPDFIRGMCDGSGLIRNYGKIANVEIHGPYYLLKWLCDVSPVEIRQPSQFKSTYRVVCSGTIKPAEFLSWVYSGNYCASSKKSSAARKVIKKHGQ